MNRHVSNEDGIGGEALGTHRALVRALSTMRPLVFHQRGAFHKPLITHGATVRLFPCVDAIVLSQIRALDKTLGTDSTLVRPMTRVCPKMFGQSGPLSVRLKAQHALIGSMDIWSPLVSNGRGAPRETRLEILMFRQVGVLCTVAGRVPLGSSRLAGALMPPDSLVAAEAFPTVTTDMRFVFRGHIRRDIMGWDLRLFHLDHQQRDVSGPIFQTPIASLVRFAL